MMKLKVFLCIQDKSKMYTGLHFISFESHFTFFFIRLEVLFGIVSLLTLINCKMIITWNSEANVWICLDTVKSRTMYKSVKIQLNPALIDPPVMELHP